MAKLPCYRCGAMILPMTARKYDGICAPCSYEVDFFISRNDPKFDEWWQKHNEENSCPKCWDGRKVTQLDWQRTQEDPFQYHLKRFTETLKKIDRNNSDYLLECSSCKAHWLLDLDETKVRYITPGYWDYIQAFNESDFVFPAAQIQNLKHIGGTEESHWGWIYDCVEYPCEVTTVDGQEYPLAIVRFVELPFVKTPKKQDEIPAKEIKSIRPSIYALPVELREQLWWNANEAAKGFGVFTDVFGPDGQRYIMKHFRHFYSVNGMPGSEFRLASENDALDMPLVKRRNDLEKLPKPVYFLASLNNEVRSALGLGENVGDNSNVFVSW